MDFQNSLLKLSKQVENLLVERNLRGMRDVQPALNEGYYLRAAQRLFSVKGTVLIGTGFPVAGTFETDGPVGAIALYHCLKKLNKTPVIVCGEPLYSALYKDFDCYPLPLNDIENAQCFAQQLLSELKPELVISIERPGLAANNRYHNMRGENISQYCGCFDAVIELADCPTIAIGDGGNEIGMGNITHALAKLAITPAKTCCDELLIADVSNWGAYGLMAFLSIWQNRNLLEEIDLEAIFKYLSGLGSVDGVTRENSLTEDSLCFSEGLQLLGRLQQLCGFK
ncbi:DUF4392 domain-containing protein [Paraferrimonas sp. SM1919]|uniref:DUF4392 domain-containing protein n=1 Tax=Paraferrimonas sp. SM1919 TaxID=2662263 RepID=UPI0013D6F7C0|nr:DUF4392 domain-containing protein [Paraferrimonas sp. SM1919]